MPSIRSISGLQPLTGRDGIWLVFIVSIASAVRLYNLAESSLWLDEAFTANLAQLPLSTLWITPYDPSPPLYYTLVRVVMLVWGDSEFLLRLPSAVFGILTIPIIYLVTRRLADTTAAVVASFVLAISFYNIGYSQEASTMYTLIVRI